ARPVTITPDSGQSKVFGSSDPALTSTNNSGLVAADFSRALSRAPGSNVGTYAITLGGPAAVSPNYTLVLSGTTVNFAINLRPVTVTVDAGQHKTYGDDDPLAFSYHITSGSLAFTDGFTGFLTRDAGENVGSYAINQHTLSL